MIRRLTLTNYRSYHEATLKLEPLSVLVGPAGAGKSNAFKALVLLQNSIHRTLDELFPPGLNEFGLVRSRWAAETDPIRFGVDVGGLAEFPEDEARYELAIADAPSGLYVLAETLQRRPAGGDWRWCFRRGSKPGRVPGFGDVDPHETPTLLHKAFRSSTSADDELRFAQSVARSLSTTGYFHLEASRLRRPGGGRPTTRLGYAGEDLPDFLSSLENEPQTAATFERIVADLRELLPALEEILILRTDVDRQTFGLRFRGQRGHIAAPDLSDGTLFTLGLLCVLRGPKPPSLLCIEEPETGLHPRRLRWLFERLVRLTHPDEGERPVQALLTTHAPHLLDLFHEMPSAVQVVELHDGCSRVTPLPDILARLHADGSDGVGIGHAWAAGLYEGL